MRPLMNLVTVRVDNLYAEKKERKFETVDYRHTPRVREDRDPVKSG